LPSPVDLDTAIAIEAVVVNDCYKRAMEVAVNAAAASPAVAAANRTITPMVMVKTTVCFGRQHAAKVPADGANRAANAVVPSRKAVMVVTKHRRRRMVVPAPVPRVATAEAAVIIATKIPFDENPTLKAFSPFCIFPRGLSTLCRPSFDTPPRLIHPSSTLHIKSNDFVCILYSSSSSFGAIHPRHGVTAKRRQQNIRVSSTLIV
jgi:hypothetical protein